MREDTLKPTLLFKLEDRPPLVASAFVGLQHLLAVFGGIIAAPLLLSIGMGLPVEDTTYLISAALIVSGFATLVQINRIGMMGSGLLSVQGTSFAFIGPLIFAYESLVMDRSSAEALGVIFGSSAVCAAIIMVGSIFVRQLRDVITTNVAGATIILLGVSLVHVTLMNLRQAFDAAGGMDGDGLWMMGLTTIVFVTILVVSFIGNAWIRLSSITIGLTVGVLASVVMGFTDWSGLSDLPPYFLPEFSRYTLAVDWYVVAMIFPIFLVSAVESIGDLTATNNLSGLETGSADYWLRIRGGIMADGFNSVVASLFCTFPNTTFSQNNGVIRLTGVCSRHVGNYVAAMLIFLGAVPVVAALFQSIPSVVIFGATLLMFVLVGLSGVRVVELSDPGRRDWVVVLGAIGLGYLISGLVDLVPGISVEVAMVLQFPVSTGAMMAIVLEYVIPGRVRDTDASD